ncbi:hypothetical protein HT031_003537 [Scenedesmus sp. PABB004]|nr:hypothetical protein HT031_003537 [Scenedesmus sp. PABB004]
MLLARAAPPPAGCCRCCCAARQRQRRRRGAACAAQRDDAPPPAPPDALVSSLTAIGLSGSVAVAGAALLGYAPFSLFAARPGDVALGLRWAAPLVLLEAALFAPRWPPPDSLLLPPPPPPPGANAGGGARRELDLAALGGAGLASPASWALWLSTYRAALLLRGPGDGAALDARAAVPLVVARETAKELLQRGLVATAAARWLTDRFYEAGADDVVHVAGLPLPLPEFGLCAGALLATALFAPTALIAAEEAAEAVGAALLMQTEPGRAVRRAAAAAAAAAAAGGSGAGTPAGSQQPPGGAGAGAPADAGEGGAEEEAELPLDVAEYRLVKASQLVSGSAPVRLARGLTAAKELGRLALANATFVAAHGDLAATLAGALAANGAMLLWGAAARWRPPGGGGGVQEP